MITGVAEHSARVDPRITRTRTLIRNALVSLLAEKNFESISVQDIAERATVNRATFYAHYPDKFALLDAVIRGDVAGHLTSEDPLRVTDPRAMLTAVGRNVFAFVGQHRSCKIDPDFEPQFERAIEAQLTEFLEASFSDCAATLVASALVGAAMYWRHSVPKAAPEPIIAEIVGILVDGVEKHLLRPPS